MSNVFGIHTFWTLVWDDLMAMWDWDRRAYDGKGSIHRVYVLFGC